jgi:hypothetical protein
MKTTYNAEIAELAEKAILAHTLESDILCGLSVLCVPLSCRCIAIISPR